MSGDLRDPGRSLVRGTFAAIGVGFAVYLVQILLCGGSTLRADLIERPYRSLLAQALPARGYLVVAGVFAATLSSAIGSFLGAPRVLQAVARDRIVPGLGPFARGTRRRDEPREALWLTLAITLAVVALAARGGALGAFDRVAAVVTMFFLCTYGTINFAAFLESFGANPSFRPRFRFYHWSASLLGAVLCAGIMLRIDRVAAAVAAAVLAVLCALISRRVYRSAFGDARRGFLYAVLRRVLARLGRYRADAKNWRPSLLVFTGNPRTRADLVQYAVWLEARCGIVSAVHVLGGTDESLYERRRALLDGMTRFFRDRGVAVFPEVVVAADLDDGMRVAAQAHSIGPLKPNTAVLGWPDAPERAREYARHLRILRTLGMSLVCVRARGLPAGGPDAARRIDVWWRGRDNGALMLILAHLLTRNVEWRDAPVRVLRCVDDAAGREEAAAALTRLVHAGRIEAETRIVVTKEPFGEVLARTSRDAAAVFLGLAPPGDDAADAFFATWQRDLAQLRTAFLVCSSGQADLLA